MAHLATLPDPRCRRGRRHRWDHLLAVVCAGLASGARGPRAIFEWAAHHRECLAEQMGARWRLPSVSTLQRCLRELEPLALEQRLEAHQQEAPRATADLEVLPLDGKWVRAASAHLRGRGALAERVLLLTLATATGRVLRQRRVPVTTNEEGAAPALLAGLDLRDRLVTADAGVLSKALLHQIVAQGGHYLMAVKGDTPELRAAIAAVFESPARDRQGRLLDPTRQRHRTLEKAHGRLESRLLEVSGSLNDWLADPPAGRREAWPSPTLVLKRTSQRTCLKTGVAGRQEVTYGLCSLPVSTPAAALLGWWRSHWAIENKVFHIRDVSFGEDHRRSWRGSAPQALAALTNGLLVCIQDDERWRTLWQTIPQAIAWAAANPIHALQLVGVTATMT